VQGQGEPGPTLVVPSASWIMMWLFTMVRSNLKKTSGIYTMVPVWVLVHPRPRWGPLKRKWSFGWTIIYYDWPMWCPLNSLSLHTVHFFMFVAKDAKCNKCW
jgi:hypothetical protein